MMSNTECHMIPNVHAGGRETSVLQHRYFFSLARSSANAIAPPGCALGSGARLGSDGRGSRESVAAPPERDEVPGVSSRRIVREMRWRLTSTSITFTLTIWPGLTISCGSLTNL